MDQKDHLKLLKFPEGHGRVEACLKTVVESWGCEVLGDWYLELTLVELVNHASTFDMDEDLIHHAFYFSLLQSLLFYKESMSESD